MNDWDAFNLLGLGLIVGWMVGVVTKRRLAVKAAGGNSQILAAITELENTIMATLDETLAVVTASSTKLDSVKALVGGLKQQLADALSGVTLPPAVQEKVNAVFATASGNADKISDALDENVDPPTE